MENDPRVERIRVERKVWKSRDRSSTKSMDGEGTRSEANSERLSRNMNGGAARSALQPVLAIRRRHSIER